MIQKKSPRIWVYLILFAGIVFCLSFLLALRISLNSSRDISLSQTKQDLRVFSTSVATVIIHECGSVFAGGGEPFLCEQAVDRLLKKTAGFTPDFRISLINEEGVVVADSDAVDVSELENHRYRTEVSDALKGKEGSALRRSTVSKKDVLYYAVPLNLNGRDYALRLSMPLETNVFQSSGVQSRLTLLFLLLLAVSLGFSFLISAKLIRQIHALHRAAREYASGNFTYRPTVTSPKELMSLACELEKMAVQIQKNVVDIASSRDALQAVFSGTTEGLVVFTGDMGVCAYNTAAEKFFGVAIDEAVGKPLIQSVRNADIQSFVEKTISGMATAQEEASVQVFHSGLSYDLLVRCVPMKTNAATDAAERFLLVATDITRLKQLEQVRKDFVANVSHELKTPVTAIKGFAETLLDNPSDNPAEQRRFLEIIHSQTQRLGDIIDDLLTLSKLDQQTNPPEMMSSDISSVVKAICAGYRKAAENKKITLSCRCVDAIPHIAVNQALFQHAMENLLDNAIKYCPEGAEINCSVTATAVGSSGGKTGALIVVEDSGAGIPDVYKERVFERFFRIDKGRSRAQGGTGLGLSIVRHVVNIHGGTIRATNRPDGKPGARFEIILPSSPVPPTERTHPDVSRNAGSSDSTGG